MTSQLDFLRKRLSGLYRVLSALWLLYAAGLACSAWGSTLFSWAEPSRYVVTAACIVTCLGMIVRLVTPGRPQWTRWSMPVIGGVGVATFVLAQFGADLLGGLTFARLGYSLVLLVPALTAFVHWVAERVLSHE